MSDTALSCPPLRTARPVLRLVAAGDAHAVFGADPEARASDTDHVRARSDRSDRGVRGAPLTRYGTARAARA